MAASFHAMLRYAMLWYVAATWVDSSGGGTDVKVTFRPTCLPTRFTLTGDKKSGRDSSVLGCSTFGGYRANEERETGSVERCIVV